MDKILLSETFIVGGYLPKESHADNEAIHQNIIKSCAMHKPNRFNEHILQDLKDQKWVYEYIIHHYRSQYRKDLISFGPYVGHLEKENQGSVKKNHLHVDSLHNSPDLTVLYFSKGKGNLIIEYSNHRDVSKTRIIPIEEKKIVIFNSDLNYYTDYNTEEDYRTYINFKSQIV